MNGQKQIIRICAIVALWLAAAGASAAALQQDEIRSLFREGTELFRTANENMVSDTGRAKDLYAKAVMRFERIVDEGGIMNGKLYYNIGNCYFRMGDTGRAILNYRRAEQYISGDPNLHQNIQYACSKRADRIEEKPKTRILRILFFWHYDFSGRIRSIVFGVLFVAVWLLATLRVFVRKAWLGRIIAIFAVLSVMLLGSLLVETVNARSNKPGVIISVQTVARKGDSEGFEKSFTEPLHAGTEFILIEDRDKWLNIELADGRTCWIPSRDAELI